VTGECLCVVECANDTQGEHPVNIVYHNPVIARPQRWAGERGRQLVEALRRNGGDVLAIPPLSSLTAAPQMAAGGTAPPEGAGRGWLRAHIPRAWRGPLIRIRLLQRGTVNTVRWSWRLWRELRGAPPDILLARYLEFEWTPLVIARVLRRPLVLEVHTVFGAEGTLRGGRPSRLENWMDRVFFRGADFIWVNTPELQELVAGRGADAAKIRMVPFGVEDPGVMATPGSSEVPVEIVFVGSFYPWHGIEELLAAFAKARAQVPELRLTIIGDGLERPDCEQSAVRLGVSDAVSFPGWLDRQAVYQQLQQSHVGVAPYREMEYNYFEPVKILDYQMAGLPTVASAVGHIPQMVTDGESGILVPPDDVDALAAALVKLASDPNMRRDMGNAAHRRAHSVDETARTVLEICRSVSSAR
jgi:glycosyltransferase involved in cell wall biosynthesis